MCPSSVPIGTLGAGGREVLVSGSSKGEHHGEGTASGWMLIPTLIIICGLYSNEKLFLYSRPSQNQKIPDSKLVLVRTSVQAVVLHISVAISKQVRAAECNRRAMFQSVKNADSANPDLCGAGVSVDIHSQFLALTRF